MKKTIDYDTGLKARALWHMASTHYREAQKVERALSKLLGMDDGSYCGHLSDAMWDGDFDTALEKEEIAIKPPKKSLRRG